MQQFTEKYADQITGVIHGFDRLVFRGVLRRLQFCRYDSELQALVAAGMENYLWQNEVLFKHYHEHVTGVSQRVKKAIRQQWEPQGVPYVFVDTTEDKAEKARAVAEQRGIDSGMVCMVSATEPTPSFEHRGVHLIRRVRPCHVLYLYQLHVEFGWMHARIQTWFPFNIQVALNGREWLERQLQREQVSYVKDGNCFPWIEDFGRAQELLNQQLETNWPDVLNGFVEQLNPEHERIFERYPVEYYWTCDQSEWATDVVFREGEFLRRLMPRLVRHGLLNHNSSDVLRFFGKRVNLSGEIPARFQGTVKSDWKRRQEGERVKFSMNGNSAKFYDKSYTPCGSVFRAAETTVVNVKDFRAYRPKEGGDEKDLQWRPMRKGIADLHRRTEVSQATNDRLMNALASVDDTRSVEELTSKIQKQARMGERSIRGLRPWGEDRELLAAIHQGEFVINGFRNGHVQGLLYRDSDTTKRQKQSACVSRKLRMLRAHGVIQRVNRTHRYQLTETGRAMIVAVLTTAQTTVSQLTRLATAA